MTRSGRDNWLNRLKQEVEESGFFRESVRDLVKLAERREALK